MNQTSDGRQGESCERAFQVVLELSLCKGTKQPAWKGNNEGKEFGINRMENKSHTSKTDVKKELLKQTQTPVFLSKSNRMALNFLSILMSLQ